MFPQRHSSGRGLTYGLTYYISPNDHLVRGIESTKRIARRDTPSICVVLKEEVNEIL